MNKGLQTYILTRKIEKQGTDVQTVDVDSHLDDTLTLGENTRNFYDNGILERDYNNVSSSYIEYTQQELDHYNYINKYFRCQECGNTELNVKRFKDNWVVVRCKCGWWNGFKDGPKCNVHY